MFFTLSEMLVVHNAAGEAVEARLRSLGGSRDERYEQT